MTTAINAPLLFIDGMTLSKASKEESMIWLSKHWKEIRETIYVDESTFRLDLKARPIFSELKSILGVEENMDTVYMRFTNKGKKQEFIQVFLNKIIHYGLFEKYGDIGGRVKQTPEYKKRFKMMSELGLVA